MFNGNESGFGTEIANNLEVSLQSAHSNLIAASKSDDFLPKMASIFGGSRDLNRLQALSSSWAIGDFSQLPTIEVLPSNSMHGANGAFSEVTRTIYLSSDYLSQGLSNPDPLTGGITGVLLEEIGHFVDTLINPGSDTTGDEGELFAATVMGLPLSNAEKLLINSEDDRGFVTINGKAIAVEQSFTDIALNSLSQAPNLRASVTITETPVITIAATDANAAETATGVTPNPGTFTLTRTGNLTKALTVNYTLAGTATKGTDYSNLTGIVSFAAGASTATVKVTPTDDTLAENSETAILTLKTGTGYTLGTTTTASVTIADNETPVITIAATDANAAETATGVTPNPGTFTLTRIGNLTKALTVNYTLAGTATKGTDYSNLTGIVSFAAGASTATVKVTPTDDTLAENSETAILTLKTGTGYTLGTTTTAIVTIADNETPVISVAATDASAAETISGQTANPGRFTLTRTGNLTQALTVNYTLLGTATKGTDYTNLTGTVNFAAGSATAVVNITPIDDNLLEASETVIFTITSGTNYKLGTAIAGTVTIDNTDPTKLADFLWDKGKTVSEIGLNLKNRGFDLPTIADSVKWGVTKSDGTNLNYTDVASALWNSGHIIDARKLADLLWDRGASQQQIGQAMKYLGLSLETIADGVKRGVTKSDGTGLNDIDVAIALWNSGYSGADGLNPRKLADLLWDVGANPIAIGQAMKYLGLNLQTIADAINDGVTKKDGTHLNVIKGDGIVRNDISVGYIYVAEALWNSGYGGVNGLDPRKLADLLWDEGASQQQIGQAFNYLGLSLETIANSVKWGVVNQDGTYTLNFNDVAVAIWNSGYGLNSRKLADLLWDDGASQGEIGQAFRVLGFSLETIADSVKWGVVNQDGTYTFGFIDTALAIWNSGYSLNTGDLAGFLWNKGASQGDIGNALRYLGFNLSQIAYAIKNAPGIGFNYFDVAVGLWNSGLQPTKEQIAATLWNQGGISQGDIGNALRYLGFNLSQIADAIKNAPGIGFNYIDVALALWNSGLRVNGGQIAATLWNQGGISQGDIGNALRNLGFNLSEIAYAIKNAPGIGFNYVDVAVALWNSGFRVNGEQIAATLWNQGGISQGDIGNALRSLGFNLSQIAYAIKNAPGIGFNYVDVAVALWNSGLQPTGEQIAATLWNQGGISQGDIGNALRSLGFNLSQIAYAIKYAPGIGFNYVDVALALWNSGLQPTGEQIAAILWNQGGTSQGNIGQALRSLGFDLSQIADAIKYAPGIGFDYIDVALALWNSGFRVNGGQIAAILWNQGGTSQGDIGQALRSLVFSNEEIGYAVKNAPGIGFNYNDVALALRDSGLQPSYQTIAVIVHSLGASSSQVYGALKAAGANDFTAGYYYLTTAWATLVDKVFDVADKAGTQAKGVFDDIKESVEDSPVTKIVLSPYTLPTSIIISTAEAVKAGDIQVIVSGLEKVPFLGTAVGVIAGVIEAAKGNEKGVLKQSIISGLAVYGASSAITPKMVDFAVDIFWELKDLNYQGAISASLQDLGMQKTIADLFVTVSWSALVDPNWEKVINAALTKVGFNNASSLVNIAWDIIDQNYKEALKTGLQLVGFTNLGINQAKADAFLNLTAAIRDGNPNKAADILIALSGNNQQVIQSSWIKDLKDGNLANDRQAIQLGLSNLGFQDVTQWVNTIWSVKDGKYLDAVSGVLTLGKFAQSQDWVKIIDNLQKENYVDALSTAFKLAKFQDGQSLADAVLAVKKGDYVTAFYESLNLIEGGRDLADAFKYLIEFDLQEFITSMIHAAPLLLKVLI
ncbi:Calx-beta domain-containing protein [Nostoc sp. PA-18-2419]|uniref:Calx-beta domain-containing protein n=1 Tax=Nostoc sp. PA-18-2419 TaxID=2575443 RepID=UPI00110943F1|nr:Calx-beta domain-containing protein [Nostoc sp. PA-18-2419]